MPNFEPTSIRIGERVPVIVQTADGTFDVQGLIQGPLVFNFRSDGRSFANLVRCLAPADAFVELTAAEPGQMRKTKWRFTL